MSAVLAAFTRKEEMSEMQCVSRPDLLSEPHSQELSWRRSFWLIQSLLAGSQLAGIFGATAPKGMSGA